MKTFRKILALALTAALAAVLILAVFPARKVQAAAAVTFGDNCQVTEDADGNRVVSKVDTSLPASFTKDQFEANVWDCGSPIATTRTITVKDGIKLNDTEFAQVFYTDDEDFQLESIDLSGLDTSDVTAMNYLFNNQRGLTEIKLGGYFTTANVVYMRGMFAGCDALTTLDVSVLDTSSAEDMAYMFQDCTDLTSLDVSGFNTAKAENMSYMFQYCMSLTSLDVSGFNTAKAENMEGMFSFCSDLTSLDLSSFNTSSVNYMTNMFWGCEGLTSLNVSSFDTSKVSYMDFMFAMCSNLKTLDISSFDTSAATITGAMFCLCDNLETIYASDSFSVTPAGYDTRYMFDSCPKLTGYAGTSYDADHVNEDGACIDKKDGTTWGVDKGYFTDKAKLAEDK
ncbi:MAG: BspA family leucine-rich repeat surface protein, partial [Parasporobacterium sp.]|nr:BspA family leucine-rich repeat surface protein [Parasporobacterium sp.]